MCTCAVGDTATPGELQKAAQFGTVTDLVPDGPRVVPVGRLDFDSEGLLLLTNDGSLCKLLTCPQFKIPKTYAVLVQSKGPALTSTVPSDAALQRLCADDIQPNLHILFSALWSLGSLPSTVTTRSPPFSKPYGYPAVRRTPLPLVA